MPQQFINRNSNHSSSLPQSCSAKAFLVRIQMMNIIATVMSRQNPGDLYLSLFEQTYILWLKCNRKSYPGLGWTYFCTTTWRSFDSSRLNQIQPKLSSTVVWRKPVPPPWFLGLKLSLHTFKTGCIKKDPSSSWPHRSFWWQIISMWSGKRLI
jgi:hypothetical protein